MSLWDLLFAGKPNAGQTLNPVEAFTGVFAPEIAAIKSSIHPVDQSEPAILPPGPEPNRSPGAAFDQALNQGGQDEALQNTLQQFQFIIVDASVSGPVQGFFPADVDANVLAVLPRVSDEAGNIIETAPDAVIFFKINQQSNLMLPLSYASQPQGSPLNALGSIQGNIRRLWLSVSKPSSDPSNKYVVLCLMKDVSFAQPGGAGSFTTASVSSTPGAGTSVQGAGGAAAPSGGGSSGGGTGGSGGGGFTSPTGGPAGGIGGGGAVR